VPPYRAIQSGRGCPCQPRHETFPGEPVTVTGAEPERACPWMSGLHIPLAGAYWILAGWVVDMADRDARGCPPGTHSEPAEQQPTAPTVLAVFPDGLPRLPSGRASRTTGVLYWPHTGSYQRNRGCPGSGPYIGSGRTGPLRGYNRASHLQLWGPPTAGHAPLRHQTNANGVGILSGRQRIGKRYMTEYPLACRPGRHALEAAHRPFLRVAAPSLRHADRRGRPGRAARSRVLALIIHGDWSLA
jgi:hypothetical protein